MRFTPLLIVVLAAACAGSPPATPAGAPSPPSLVASPPAITPAGPADWRPLADGLWLPETPFAVAFAANRSDFDALLARLGQAGPPPAVDFASEVALFMGMSGSSSCPERLERVVVDHAAARVYGQWAQRADGQACTDDLGAQGILLAFPRAELPDGAFVLSLRDQPICADCIDQPDRMIVEDGA